jgi:hypothetical protein
MIDQATRDKICEQLADGMSLRAVCRQDGMPSIWSFLREVEADPALAQQYVRAKESGIEAMAADTLHIANTPQLGVIKTIKPDGTVEEKHADMIEHRRLQVDTRKWLLSKLAPKKYGDKVQHTGEGGGPIQEQRTVTFVWPKADADG